MALLHLDYGSDTSNEICCSEGGLRYQNVAGKSSECRHFNNCFWKGDVAVLFFMQYGFQILINLYSSQYQKLILNLIANYPNAFSF